MRLPLTLALAAALAAFAATPLAELLRTAASVRPSVEQIAWQKLETTAFIHFTVNTFTGKEWGDGSEPEQIFNPSALDAEQWARTARDAGLKLIILTAKHHDGFCLWPSRYTEHSVKNSPWRGGKGDLVKEVSAACHKYGLRFGVYLSPWDRHEPTYGTPAYNTYYRNQLRELLTNYGDIAVLWLDGAKGQGEKAQQYDWEGFYQLARQLQPHILIHGAADKDAAALFAGNQVRLPDIRWVGNESGAGRETEWSVIPLHGPVLLHDAQQYDLGSRTQVEGAERFIWYPAEVDVSIRPGWFYHAEQDDKVRPLDRLLDIYYQSVGANAVLLLNLPPDRRGLIHENDVSRLKEWRAALDATFARPVAEGTGEFEVVEPFNVIALGEKIEQGQRVESFVVEARQTKQWHEIARGTTIGYKRLLRLPSDVSADRVRLRVLESRDTPAISHFAVYHAPDSARGFSGLEFKWKR